MTATSNKEEGYALDRVSAARHVATELERADAALSVVQLATTYTHPIPADLKRIRRHHGCKTDKEAQIWLIRHVCEQLRGVEPDGDDSFRLTKAFEDVHFIGERKRLTRIESKSPWPGGRGVFNPMTDRFRELFEHTDKAADDELRESMRLNGWLEDLPAIVDERDFVLVGNRRMRIAKELGIEPVTTLVKVGREGGDSGEAARLRLALCSNLGFSKLPKNNRERIAKHLYGEGWSQARIAEALSVDQAQISRDLNDDPTLCAPHNVPRKDSRGRTASTGRPKASLTHGQKVEIERLTRRGVTQLEIERQVNNPNALSKASNAVLAVIKEVKAQMKAEGEGEGARPSPPSLPAPTPRPTPVPAPTDTFDQYWDDRIAGCDAGTLRFVEEILALNQSEQQQVARKIQRHLQLKVA